MNTAKKRAMETVTALEEEKQRTLEKKAQTITGVCIGGPLWSQYGKYLGEVLDITPKAGGVDLRGATFNFTYRAHENPEAIMSTEHQIGLGVCMGAHDFWSWCQKQIDHHEKLAKHFGMMQRRSPEPYPLPDYGALRKAVADD